MQQVKLMKKILFLAVALSYSASTTWAHQPYLAPLSFKTANTQIPVVAGFAEDALISEHALKDSALTVISPSKKTSTIQSPSALKSATVFDLPLDEDGTYHLSSKVTFPIKYTIHDQDWKIFVDMPADKAGPLKDREYVIPADFKDNKVPAVETITREWLIQSYLTKNKNTAVASNSNAILNVQFSVHPNEIKANSPIKLTVKKKNQNVKEAKISVLAKGQTEKQATELVTNAQGVAEIKFPKSGEYLVVVHEKIDVKKKPSNEFFTITSISVQP